MISLPSRVRGWRFGLVYSVIVAGVTALLLAQVVPFGPFPLAVPFHYGGDGVLLAAIAKGVAEDGPLHLTRIGAPFGSDIVDWPLGMWLPFAFTTLIARATGEAGLALNLLWLTSTVLTAVTAAGALRRLGHAADLAFVLGIAYAFLPYGFYRNVGHVNLVFPLVPLLALAGLRACGRPGVEPDASETWLTRLACLAQGLSFIYYSFFAAWLLVVGAALGWFKARSSARLRSASVALLLLVVGAAIPVVPSALYWKEHGRNDRLQYKLAAEADHLGLELRQMLLPIDDHPLPPLRQIATRMGQAFRDDGENATARLGTLGSLGLIVLVGFVFARVVSQTAPRTPLSNGEAAPGGTRAPGTDLAALGPAAALTLAALLLAQVGGLGSLFNAVVAPDIRAYNRIVVFIAFFALHALAVLLARVLERLQPLRAGGVMRAALLVALAAAAIADQVPRQFLASLRWSKAPAFTGDAAFVSTVEAALPAGAMVFQLPHATIPLDLAAQGPVELYDSGRAFLHSHTLRWSWGSIIGRRGDWQTQVSKLSPAAIARRVALAGFDGLWIDRWGYPETSPLPWRTLESQLAEATGATPFASADGRYSFLRLLAFRDRLARELGPEALAGARKDALESSALQLRWREGCSDEHGDIREPSRVCGSSGWAVLKNDAPRERRLQLEGRFHALRPGTLRLHGDGFADELPLRGETRPYRREITIGAQRRLRLAFEFEGPCEATAPRARCVEIIDMKAVPLAPGAEP